MQLNVLPGRSHVGTASGRYNYRSFLHARVVTLFATNRKLASQIIEVCKVRELSLPDALTRSRFCHLLIDSLHAGSDLWDGAPVEEEISWAHFHCEFFECWIRTFSFGCFKFSGLRKVYLAEIALCCMLEMAGIGV